MIAEVRALGISTKGPTIPYRKLCGCFTAGTTVLTSNGNISIEKVLAGDSIWVYSNETEKLELKKVADTFSSEQNEVFKIQAGEKTIQATHDQLFFDKVKWLKTTDLSVGDTLVLYDGSIIVISSIERSKGIFKVHNLIIEDSYFTVASNLAKLFYNNIPNWGAPVSDIKKALQMRR